MINTGTWTVKNNQYESAGDTGLLNVYKSESVYTDTDGLHIQASKGSGEYISGWIDTLGKRSWLYGYFEARMFVPNIPGIWSGFFLINNAGYPPEIDAGEIFKDDGKIQFQIRQGSADYKQLYSFGPSLLGQWHTYGFLWEPAQVVWYIDGQRYWSSSQYVPNMPMAMFIILGMGEWQVPNDNLLPDTLDVAYVRVWQRP